MFNKRFSKVGSEMVDNNLTNLINPFKPNIPNLKSKDNIPSAPTLNTGMEEARVDISVFEYGQSSPYQSIL